MLLQAGLHLPLCMTVHSLDIAACLMPASLQLLVCAFISVISIFESWVD